VFGYWFWWCYFKEILYGVLSNMSLDILTVKLGCWWVFFCDFDNFGFFQLFKYGLKIGQTDCLF